MSEWNDEPLKREDPLVRSLDTPAPGGKPAYAGVSAGEDDAHLLDYVRALYKRRWTAITVFLVIVLTVTVQTFTATPIYQATTRLLIEADTPNVVSFQQVIEEQQARADYYQTQYNILESRALARKTLDSLNLWNTKPFGGPQEQAFSVRGSISGAMGWVAGLFGAQEEDAIPEPDETAAQSRAVTIFLSGLSITPVRTSRLVDVTFSSPDPALATRIVNELAKSYISQNLEYRFTASKEASGWLSEQLAAQRTQVQNAEVALQRYREQNDAISFEDRENIVVQKLSDLSTAVTRAKTERLQKEANYQQLADVDQNPAAIDTFPSILNNPFIQQQKAELATLQRNRAQAADRLDFKHPEMQKYDAAIRAAEERIATEVRKVVQSVRTEFQAAQIQEQAMTGALNQQKGEALTMNRRAIEYSVLLRDVESSKQIYDSLLQRAKETGISGNLRSSNIRVVDPAERPRTPSSPRKGMNLLLALFGGVLASCAVVFFFEYLDNRIKTPDEIRTHLGLASLGLLPLLPKTDGSSGYPLIGSGVPANFAEAFRGIRTNILFSAAVETSRSIIVTSTGPGEGKTMVACNLAVALAQSGQRVLLIDADMRRPKVHEAFEQALEPGLSNVIVGASKISEAAQKTLTPGLWVLPAGRIPPNPAELLGSQRFQEFLRSLREHFDWVVLDSPPVMAVTDSAVLAHTQASVLFVVGAEMTSRHTAMRAIEQLDSVNARFAGAVLNRVDLTNNSYYYSHYYRREYAQYYVRQS